MKRLLKISLDQALLSLTPILSWFLLSFLVDKNLINVFTLTYPLQCFYGIIRSPFAVGANISKTRDKNKDAVMTGMMLGIIMTIAIFGYILPNVDSYIAYMNMDPNIYRVFTVYSIMTLALQTIFSFVLEKLYYENQNSLANKYSLAYNCLNFGIVIGMAILSKNQFVIVGVSLLVMALFTIYVIAKNCQRFRPHLNIIHCIKYDSTSLATSCFALFTYLFGLSNALEFGPEFGLAITFSSLVTDTQWDVFESISTLAKIDISQKKFNFKQSIRHAYGLLMILYATSILMFVSLFSFYALDLKIALAFFGLEIIDFILCPAYYVRTAFLQLNWSATGTTINRVIARIGRLGCSFLPTPFCNNIGAIAATAYQVVTTRFIFRRNYYTDKNGKVYRRRNHQHHLLPRFRYQDLPIEDE